MLSNVIRPKIIFFDCWYTLFFGNMAEDLRTIAGLLGVPFDHKLVKTFEQIFMTRPDVNFDRPARELVAHYGAASELASEVARILTAGLESQRPYPDTLAALDKLRKSYKLGLITNVGRPGYERLNADYDLKAHFDCLIPSYELGVVKPDPLMFRRALDLAGARPDEALMVGDNVSDDVEPARALSMRAVLLDRRNRFPDFPGRVTDLAQLMSSLQIT